MLSVPGHLISEQYAADDFATLDDGDFLAYGGSVGALKAMGALEMGLAEEELQPLVNAWRQSNPNIVRFWWDVDTAVKKVIRKKSRR